MFESLHDFNESNNILDLFKKGTIDKDNKAAYFYGSLIIYYKKAFPEKIDESMYEEALIVLDSLSENGNYYASEKLGFIFDSRRDYSKAFTHISRATKYFLPKSVRQISLYYFSLKNPIKQIEQSKGLVYCKQAYFLGIFGSLLFLSVQKEKDWERLIILSQLGIDLNIYGSYYFLGKCYEKGRGVQQNLEIAMSIFMNTLNKKSNLFYSLYRIAKIYELERKHHLSSQVYRVVYMIHKSILDKKIDNEKWILNAYRMASMLSSGKGVARDLVKSNIICDEIYNKRFDEFCDSFTTHLVFNKVPLLKEKNLKEISMEKEIMHLKLNPIINFKSEKSNKKEILYKPDSEDKHSHCFFENNEVELNNLIEIYEESHEIQTKFLSESSQNISSSEIILLNHFPETKLGTVNSEIIESRLNKELDELYKSKKFTSQELSLIKKNIQLIKKNIEFLNLKDVNIEREIAVSKHSIVSYGLIYNEKVIVKEFKINSGNQILRVFDEILIQSILKHKNINKIQNLCLGFNPLRIMSINKYLNSTLRSILQKVKLNKRAKFHISIQILEAINHMHNHHPPIVHCDLKLENILIDENWNVEIWDFSLSKVLWSEIIQTNDIFTPRYSPPELIKNKITTKARDIWAIGLILYEIFNGMHLFEEKSTNNFIESLMSSNSLNIQNNYFSPNEITDLVRKCLEFDFEKRPVVSLLLERMKTIFLHLDDSQEIY